MTTTQSDGRPPEQQLPLPLKRRLFRSTFTTCGYLVLAVLVLIIGSFVLLPLALTWLLWCYISIAAICIIFPSVFITRYQRGQSLTALLSAARWSVIVVGLSGLLLGAAALIVPGYKIFLAGYWLHVKIWLAPAQVRQWAASQQITADQTSDIPYPDWPESLKKTSLGRSSLTIDSEGQRIILTEGGGFGHWGIEVAAQEDNVPEVKGYVLKVAKGAWVWHELQ